MRLMYSGNVYVEKGIHTMYICIYYMTRELQATHDIIQAPPLKKTAINQIQTLRYQIIYK